MVTGQFDPQRIAIIGTGTMGTGIGATFAAAGYPVSFHDVAPSQLEAGRQRVESVIAHLENEDRLRVENADQATSALSYSTSLDEAVDGAELVVEAVSEDIEIKRSVFEDLDAHTDPETVLATNTSGLSITEIARATESSPVVVGTHWFNPPHIVPLVEVIKGDDTDDDLATSVAAFLERVGKTSVIVEKDIPGYIGNRIQMAMCYEAFSLLERGVASAEAIDTAVKAGFGFRLPAMGIFEKVDQSGLDVHHAVESYLMRELDRGTEPNPVVSRLVEEGHYGMKSGTGIYDWSNRDPANVTAETDEQLFRLLGVYESDLE